MWDRMHRSGVTYTREEMLGLAGSRREGEAPADRTTRTHGIFLFIKYTAKK